MHFESVSGLWFALTLPAIVLLYLLKRKYIDTPVSSHLLWNRVLQQLEANRPWQKLRSRLLMLVQLLAAALLVLALLNPQLLVSRASKAHVVLIVDRSASMSAAATSEDESGGSRLDEAKRVALETAREARGAVTLLAIGGEPEVLATRTTDVDALREALDGLEPYYGAAAYAETLSLADALTRSDPDAEVRLVTDGQIPEAAGTTFAAPFRLDRVGGASGGAASVGNAGVAQFGVVRAGAGDGGVSASASIRYWGETPRNIDVSVYADEERVGTKQVALRSGRPASVYFDGLPAADRYRLEAATGDAYAADDVAHAFLERDRPKRVLMVGEGNLFLEKALRLTGAEVTLLAPEGAEAWARTSAADDAPDLIVVDGVSTELLGSEAWTRTVASAPAMFLRAGYEGREAGAPAGLYEVAEHPVNRYLSYGDVHVAGVLEPTEPLGGETIVASNGVPLVIADARDGRPRLTLTFALQHSDWPLRAEFPVFVRNAADWLTGASGGSLGRAVAGARLDVAFDPLTAGARWVSYETGASIEALAASGRPASSQPAPARPGLYRLLETDAAGNALAERWLDVVPDPRESAATTSFDGVGGGNPGQTGADNPSEKSPLPIGPWLIALALAVVVWEWGVYRRGSSI